jgi:hypothetical protein
MATVTAEKTAKGIRSQPSHLRAVVEALEAIDSGQLEDIGKEAKERCTISIAASGAVAVTFALTAAPRS